MSVRIAINGFGRIGRMVLREANKNSNVEIVAINDLVPSDNLAYLLKHDSTHGRFNGEVLAGQNSIEVNGKKIECLSEKNPGDLPWSDLKIEYVIESTGLFTASEKAAEHLKAGAKKVVISAPAKEVDITIVQGVNNHLLSHKDQIISNGSCTTNCLAPIVMILDKYLGIDSGFMTTIHSFTGDQRTVDQTHTDLRRARTASDSMIPTSTGAAKTIGLVLPNLIGKLDGTAIRVPTSNVSLIDLTFQSKQKTSVKNINELMIKTSKNKKLKGILSINKLPLVSKDFNHNSSSSVFDVTQTQVIKNKFCRILSWYDNEWGFSNRMCDIAEFLHNNS